MKISDSSDVTVPGFTVVGAVRKVLVGTDAGVLRIQGNLTYDAPWVSEEVYTSGELAVRAFARAPSGEVVLAGLAGPGRGALLRTERGSSWSPVEGWPSDRPVTALGITREGRVLAGGPGGLLLGSLDGGSWEENASFAALAADAGWGPGHSGGSPTVAQVSADPRKPHRWVAAVARGGVVASGDDGTTWGQVSPVWETYGALYSLGSAALAATAEGLFQSADRGRTWGGSPAVPGRIPGLARDAGGQLFAVAAEGAPGRVVHSIDDGATWAAVEGCDELPLPSSGPAVLVADKVRPAVFLYAAGDSVWLRDETGLRRVCDGLPPVRALQIL